MSKKVLGIGLAIVGFALMAIPGIGTALGLGALSIAGASISVASLIGVGLMVASNFLMGPAKPRGLRTGATDRLTASLDPTTPRKFALGGTTALATDVRYQAFTGANQKYLEQIVCVASHKVQSIDELWLDNELAWSAASGVASKFSSFLTVTTRTEGTSANGIAIDSTWTASCTLTGCAYIHLKYLLVHDDGNGGNDSPFASGVTSRMTIRGKGALTYDPRLDSTVAGGSGSHRADDQTTWAWDANGSRNPALQLLWYLLGWKINGKLAVGKGVPKARIDLASFAVAANACDVSITKSAANGGGTEPRYRGDGVLSEGDDPGAVIDNLCVTMNAVLRDAGGKLSLTVLSNDLATPVTPSGRTAFDENDVLGEIQWDQTPDLTQSFNIVRGTRIDPSDNALYQPVDFPEVKLTSPDGIDRIDTVSYPLVQSNGQAQRLAKQRLQRNQYQGRLSFQGGPAWWGVNLGQVFAFTHAAFGWNAKLFRCAGHKMDRAGVVDIVAVEENAAIYQWDNDEAAAISAGAPTVYNQVNDPIQSVVNSTAAAATSAAATASSASASAAAANAALADIASDSLLTAGEKPIAIKERDAITAEQAGIDAQATAYGITTEKTAYDSAVTALTSYLATLTTPVLWSNLTGNTTIVGTTFRSKFNDVYAARQALLNKIAANAKALADAAQTSANSAQSAANAAQSDATSALSALTDIASDSLLTPGEKPTVIKDRDAIVAEQAGIDAQATAYGITTEKTAYDNAVTALTSYLAALTTPVLWSNLTGNTTIVGTTFRSKFNDVYAARQALLNKIVEIARATSVVIDPPADVIIYADSSGTIKSGQLPKDIGLKASIGTADVTTAAGVAWSRTVTTGVTCTIGAATGVLNVTAMSATEVYIPVSVTYAGVTRTAKVHVKRQDDPPSNSGGTGGTGGTSASTTTLGNTTGTAYDTTNAVSATLTAKAGSGGQVQCTAPLAFLRVTGAGTSATGAFGKWQWRVVGGVFADITTEVADTFDASSGSVDGSHFNDPGSLSVTMTKTGLTNGTNYEFRFLWRRVDVSGTAENITRYSGTLTATGS